VAACRVAGEVDELDVAGGGEEQRRAVEEERAGEGPQDQVLEGGLGAALLVTTEGDQGVDGDGHHLQRHEHGEEVGGHGQQQHPRGGEEHQAVVLASLHLPLAEVAGGAQRRQGQGGAHHQGEEDREVVGHGRAAENAVGRAPVAPGDPGRERREARGQPGHVGAPLALGGDLEEDQQGAAHHQGEGGGDAGDVGPAGEGSGEEDRGHFFPSGSGRRRSCRRRRSCSMIWR
jgi:hypothetical protein